MLPDWKVEILRSENHDGISWPDFQNVPGWKVRKLRGRGQKYADADKKYTDAGENRRGIGADFCKIAPIFAKISRFSRKFCCFCEISANFGDTRANFEIRQKIRGFSFLFLFLFLKKIYVENKFSADPLLSTPENVLLKSLKISWLENVQWRFSWRIKSAKFCVKISDLGQNSINFNQNSTILTKFLPILANWCN